MIQECVLSLTREDFNWEFHRSSGKGGQHRNRRETAVKCVHPPSGASGTSSDQRSQAQNRRKAFERCCAQPKFKKWLRIEVAKREGLLVDVDRKVEREMGHIRVDVKDDGKWVEEGQ